ncbi:hypothetical protein [Symbiopectobacterium purcellii]
MPFTQIILQSRIKRLGCMTQILRNRRPFIDDTFLLLSAGLWNFHLRTA